MLKKKNHRRVLALHPRGPGFAFALFDSPKKLVDWGGIDPRKDITGAKAAAGIADLLMRHRPEVLVFDDVKDRQTKRTVRLTRIYRAVRKPVEEVGAEFAVVSRKNVKLAFAQLGVLDKHGISQTIAKEFKPLASRTPKAPRRPWDGEDKRMALFDAAARALTYYRMEDEVTGHGSRS